MADIFGFRITRKKTKEKEKLDSFTLPTSDDGSVDVVGGGFYAQFLDIDGRTASEYDLIKRYRDISKQPECESAIDDIVNEAIVSNEKDSAVALNLDRLGYSDKVKGRILDEFDHVLRLLDFNIKGHDIFRRWYVDGRLYYHKVIDTNNSKKGIQELRYIDPRKIKKVREIEKKEKDERTGLAIRSEVHEYYIYNEYGIDMSNAAATGIRVSKDSITFVPSGLLDTNQNTLLSYLHKAIKPVNQLRMIEDSAVIYRITRAPERRIFYIDVGNLPKNKAEQYLADTMNRYRNKLVYDANTGEIRDDRNHMSMLEDFWLPRREGGRGTEITTLPGGQNLGEIEDIRYFQKKLYRSLNVPVSRLEAESTFSLGRSNEITRDELKFSKFVQRVRKRFSNLFHDLLKTQLILKGVIAEEEWKYIKEHVQYDYKQDGYFTELKNAEMWNERVNLLSTLESYVGTYFSKDWVRRNILRMNDAEIQDIESQIEKEKEEGGDDDLGF